MLVLSTASVGVGPFLGILLSKAWLSKEPSELASTLTGVTGNSFLGESLPHCLSTHLSAVCPGLAFPLSFLTLGWSLQLLLFWSLAVMRWQSSKDLVLPRSFWRHVEVTSRGQPSMLLSLLGPVQGLWGRDQKAFRLFAFGWSKEPRTWALVYLVT